MEVNQAPIPLKNEIIPKILSQSFEFSIPKNKNQYQLKIETYTDESIEFNLRQTNIVSFIYYKKQFNYNEIMSKLLLVKEYYSDINKVLKFIEIAITKKKLSIIEDKENRILNLKKIIDYDEIDFQIILEKKYIKKDEMINIMFEEMKDLKNKMEVITSSNLKKKDEEIKPIDNES